VGLGRTAEKRGKRGEGVREVRKRTNSWYHLEPKYCIVVEGVSVGRGHMRVGKWGNDEEEAKSKKSKGRGGGGEGTRRRRMIKTVPHKKRTL